MKLLMTSIKPLADENQQRYQLALRVPQLVGISHWNSNTISTMYDDNFREMEFTPFYVAYFNKFYVVCKYEYVCRVFNYNIWPMKSRNLKHKNIGTIWFVAIFRPSQMFIQRQSLIPYFNCNTLERFNESEYNSIEVILNNQNFKKLEF